MIQTQEPDIDFVVQRFKALSQSGCLAHAYLFIGPQGIGKGEAALMVAKLVNCEDSRKNADFCDQCSACRKINSGGHPDVKVIDSDRTESIKIEQIRMIISDLQLRAYEAKKKVVIIRNIENLTIESGNALLKTLEEPPLNSLIILTTSVPERNLDTIKSRCHAIHFFPHSHEMLEKKLAGEYKFEPSEARFLSHYSQGYPQRARDFGQNKLFAQKNQVIDQFILSRQNEQYLKTVSSDKDKTKEVLDVMYTWFRDLLLLKSGVGQMHLSNVDRFSELQKLENQYSVRELWDIIDEIVKTARLLSDNLNVKIPLNIIKEKLWRKS